jgi:hypothetical protein
MRMVAGLLSRAARLAARLLKFAVQRVQTDRHIQESAKAYGKSPYGEHLKAVAEGKVRY